MRIFKRETAAYWVDIYFFGSKAADSFECDSIPGVLRSSRIGLTQVQVLTTNHRVLEAAAKEHERLALERVRAERLEQIAALAEADADAAPVVKKSVGGRAEIRAASAPKKKGCRGCGKK